MSSIWNVPLLFNSAWTASNILRLLPRQIPKSCRPRLSFQMDRFLRKSYGVIRPLQIFTPLTYTPYIHWVFSSIIPFMHLYLYVDTSFLAKDETWSRTVRSWREAGNCVNHWWEPSKVQLTVLTSIVRLSWGILALQVAMEGIARLLRRQSTPLRS